MLTWSSLASIGRHHITPKVIHSPLLSSNQSPLLDQLRWYAKKKEKRASSDSVQPVDDFDFEKSRSRMINVVQSLTKELSKIRVGRANPELLEGVKVSVDNQSLPLRELGQVIAKDAQNLIVIPNDQNVASAIVKSIRNAGLNFNPVVDASGIKVPIPRLSKDVREKNLKDASLLLENFKVQLRKVRELGIKDAKATYKKDVDYVKYVEKEIQKQLDEYVKKAEDVLERKKKELKG